MRIMQTLVARGLIAVIGLLATARDARALACGDTIGPNAGLVTMTADLACGAVPFFGLRVVGPGTVLDMKGHRLGCGPVYYPGIQIIGTGAVVENGHVDGCGIGVDVPNPGLGAHTIRNIYSSYHDQVAFHIAGDANRLFSNTASGTATLDGFAINGRHNTLVANTAYGNNFAGFASYSNGNKFIRNYSFENGSAGFSCDPSAVSNIFLSNIADKNPTAVATAPLSHRIPPLITSRLGFA